MQWLFTVILALEEYARSGYYPYHMPGHKRRLAGETLAPVAAWDITEIDGFDNLHDATINTALIPSSASSASSTCAADAASTQPKSEWIR